MPEKIIRDPVHDVIAFRLDQPIDSLLFQLVNCAEFQRLRRIRQLGMASLAYPGADHSRYSHSLGVMETARKILFQLRQSHYLSEDDVAVCLAGALLHDLGHGPFSHVFERVSGVRHELFTYKIIRDETSEVNRVLVKRDPSLPQRIVDLLEGVPGSGALAEVLSSQLDADRLDYLLRDNLMTGSQYGDYDLNWLVHALTIDRASNRLAITFKGISAVEAYLQSRYHMYRNVYFHKVVRSGEGMLKLALQRAKRLAVQGRLSWPPEENPVFKALIGQQLTVEEFSDLDDVSVMHCFKLWVHNDDATLASLCRGLLGRQLFKTFDFIYLGPNAAAAAADGVAAAITARGGDAGYDMFFDQASDEHDPTDEIQVQERDGSLRPFSQLSPFLKALDKQLAFRRLHVAEEWWGVAKEQIATI